MALTFDLHSLPAPRRVAPPLASAYPSHRLLPQASFSRKPFKKIRYIGPPSGKTAERVRTPSTHWCRAAVSDPWAARSSGNGSSMDAVGVVIVDHGSKRAEANEMLEEFASMYRLVVVWSSPAEQDVLRNP